LVAGRYRLTKSIGSGAMGVVWQAYDERLQRTIALKQLLLQPGLSRADADEARARAMREGRIAARLQHPNAVTVYDVVEHEDQPVLIMEYVPSRSLGAALDQNTSLPPREVARIGAQVATALVAAHAAGIVHRDIKPGNVLLAEDGTVKITDFGISRAVGDVTVTATGMLAGTPAYLAPEVAKGEPPGSASDVFSLASTLYAAVEGQPPFGLSDNTLAVLHAVAACRITPPRQAGPLTALLMRMLAATPAERPTMPEVSSALSAIAAGTPAPVSEPYSAPHGIPSFSQDHPRAMAAANPSRMPTRTMLDARPMSQFGYGSDRQLTTVSSPTPNHTPGSPNRNPWRKGLLTALAIVLAALLGILVANTFTSTSNTGLNAPQTSNLAAPANTEQLQASIGATTDTTALTTTIATTTTAAPTTSSTDNTKITVAEMAGLLTTYYSLLPQHPGQAWQLLSAKVQAKAKGFSTYQGFWKSIAQVKMVAIAPHGNDSTLAVVSFTTTDGKMSIDTSAYKFVRQNGQLLIDDSTPVAG